MKATVIAARAVGDAMSAADTTYSPVLGNWFSRFATTKAEDAQTIEERSNMSGSTASNVSAEIDIG